MNERHSIANLLTRRHFFGRSASGLGAVALASILNEKLFAETPGAGASGSPLQSFGVLPRLHHTPKAKRVIYLFMSGGPSHIDLFDYKPALKKLHGTELPATVRMGQRV